MVVRGLDGLFLKASPDMNFTDLDLQKICHGAFSGRFLGVTKNKILMKILSK